MIRAERFFPDRQTALVERLGIGVTALAAVQLRQIAEAAGDFALAGR